MRPILYPATTQSVIEVTGEVIGRSLAETGDCDPVITGVVVVVGSGSLWGPSITAAEVKLADLVKAEPGESYCEELEEKHEAKYRTGGTADQRRRRGKEPGAGVTRDRVVELSLSRNET